MQNILEVKMTIDRRIDLMMQDPIVKSIARHQRKILKHNNKGINQMDVIYQANNSVLEYVKRYEEVMYTQDKYQPRILP